MKLKSALLAVLAGSAAIAAPAFADNGWHHGRSHAPARVVVRPVVVPPRVAYAPAPVTVAPSYYYSTPAPVFYSPAPVYYRPAPVYYRPAPVYTPAPVAPGISIRFHLPL